MLFRNTSTQHPWTKFEIHYYYTLRRRNCRNHMKVNAPDYKHAISMADCHDTDFKLVVFKRSALLKLLDDY